jgi:hypothetical protein
MRGGARPGAGRPRGSANRKSREIADEAAASGNVLPLSYLLDVLNSPASTRAQKLHAASIAAPFVHPRLSAVSVASHGGGNLGGGGGGDSNNIDRIFAVPRGAALNVKEGTVTIDGTVLSELQPVSPFTPTPPLGLTDQTQPVTFEPPSERMPVIELEESANVTRLDSFVRKRDDDPSGAA